MKKTRFIFYFLVFYILLQFAWWLYLIIDLNHQVYILKQDVLPENWFTRKIWMIAGEGLIFLLLLLLGTYIIYYFLNRQMKIARQQQNFLLSITHELKTPLTSLQMTLENILKPQLSDEQKYQLIKNGKISLQRLSNLLDNLIYSAKTSGEELVLSTNYANLSSFVEQALQTFNTSRIQKNIEPKIYTVFSEEALRIILFNLVDNALKYSEEPITVKLYTNQSMAVIEVQDTGIGIPEPEKKNIFKQFYRVGDEKTRKAKGTGTGLFLAQKFAQYQKAQIFVKNNTPKGAIFVVKIPIIKNNE